MKGRRFGHLTVIEPALTSSGRPRWQCLCDCGGTKVVLQSNLVGGHTKSCGCLRGAVNRVRNVVSSPSRKYKDPTVSARNTVITNYKKSAKERGFEWGLTVEECDQLFRLPCVYCGSPPSNVCQMYGGTRKPLPPFRYSGIDRRDPKRGYTRDNTVSCCMTCNRAKFQMTSEEFEGWIRKVFHHLPAPVYGGGMNDPLPNISDALITFARGSAQPVIPKVVFSVERTTVETPEAGPEWKATATLFGIESFNEEGHPNVLFSYTFEGEGDYKGSLSTLAAKVVDFLDEQKAIRVAEAEACGLALDALKQAIPEAAPPPPVP